MDEKMGRNRGGFVMKFIKNKEINNALDIDYRQYLTGHLSRPQIVKHIDSDIEVGISYYKKFTADIPHVHPIADEHCYVLCGKVKVRCFEEEMKEYEFNEGDFFFIPKGIPHASKNYEGTKVLFIKNPSINDKTIIDVDENTKEWLKKWEL